MMMPSSAKRSVLFFRTYREATLPLYAALVDELCASPHLPFQLATVLEDIGQDFIKLAETVNAALKSQGLLDCEVDADLTVEAQIDSILTRMAEADSEVRSNVILQQALRIALCIMQELPSVQSNSQGQC